MSFDNVEPVSRATASDRIADSLRAAILDGSMRPGAQLKETALAQQLQVSRGPLREAIQRLIQEGLLRTKAHHGTFVVELTRDDAADVYMARRAIETSAAVRIMEMDDRADVLSSLKLAVSNLRDAVKDEDWTAIASADIAFHQTLVDSASSKRLSRMFRTLAAETRLCMNELVEHPEWVKRAVSDHKALVAALSGSDTNVMLEQLHAHLSLEDFLTYHGDTYAVAAAASA